MTFLEFTKSMEEANPPGHVSPLLLALWYDGKGNWTKAHNIAQEIKGRDGALVHAYLHRKEGDLWNARYWYTNAGADMPQIDLDAEWSELVRKYLT